LGICSSAFHHVIDEVVILFGICVGLFIFAFPWLVLLWLADLLSSKHPMDDDATIDDVMLRSGHAIHYKDSDDETY
jgi:hypothetical protein